MNKYKDNFLAVSVSRKINKNHIVSIDEYILSKDNMFNSYTIILSTGEKIEIEKCDYGFKYVKDFYDSLEETKENDKK